MKYAPIPSQLFVDNRRNLATRLPAGSLAVLTANDPMPTNADGTMGFRQNSDLFYLSGVDQEDTVLIIFPGAKDPERRECLFLKETSELIAIWDGVKLSKDDAIRSTGIKSVFWLSDYDRILRELMYEVDTVYLNHNEHLRCSSEVQTREDRLINSLRQRFPLHRQARLAPVMHQLRMVKSATEIALLREATRITELGFKRLLTFLKPGVGEWELEAEMAHEYIRNRSRGFAYPPIIGSGPNACVLHYVSSDRVCQDGELVLLDCAAEYANYFSDLTRTIPVNGRFTPWQRKVYDAVHRVLNECNQMLRPGVVNRDYQKEVNLIMEKELVGLGLLKKEDIEKQDPKNPLYRKYFMHGVSHHIGLDVHDVNDPWAKIVPGMVFTIEPGIYIREQGLGVRLENIVVIGETENENLMANIPIDADEIESLMNARR